MVELHELLFRWQQGENLSQISRSLGQSRQTVREYLNRAQQLGFTRDAGDAQRAEVVREFRETSTNNFRSKPRFAVSLLTLRNGQA